jgi:hypothetical protein
MPEDSRLDPRNPGEKLHGQNKTPFSNNHVGKGVLVFILMNAG